MYMLTIYLCLFLVNTCIEHSLGEPDLLARRDQGDKRSRWLKYIINNFSFDEDFDLLQIRILSDKSPYSASRYLWGVKKRKVFSYWCVDNKRSDPDSFL